MSAVDSVAVRGSHMASEIQKGTREDLEQALAKFRGSGDKLGEAQTLRTMGEQPDLEQALAIYQEINDRIGQAHSLRALGELKAKQNDLGGARTDLDQALVIYREN